jgi:hypothetical protein
VRVLYSGYKWITVNDELKGMWKKAVMVYIDVISQNLPRGTQENIGNFSQDRM